MNMYFPVMESHNRLSNSQSKPIALCFRTRSIYAVEPIKNSCLVFRSNTNTGILDLEDTVMLLLRQSNSDLPVLRGIFQSIIDNIEKKLSEECFLSDNYHAF